MSLDTLNGNARRYATLSLLLYSLVGVPALSPSGCERMQVQDPATGAWRDATVQEKQTLVNQVGETATSVAQQVPGGVAFMPIIQLATQIGALMVAWRIRPKDPPATPTATVTAATASPPAG